MGAFKQHCRFGLWGAEIAESLKEHGFETEDSTGSFRRMTSVKDRRDYIEWISRAKRPETHERRIDATVAQVVEGKNLNWKYEKC